MDELYIVHSCTLLADILMQRAGKGEYELKNMRKESEGSTIQIFVVVDQDSGMARALKVSKAIHHVTSCDCHVIS